MVVAMMELTGKAELYLAIGAVVLLGMATFGLDSIVFSKKRKAGRDPRAPKERITYIEVDADEEEPEERPKPVR